jgi:hypothetical protein
MTQRTTIADLILPATDVTESEASMIMGGRKGEVTFQGVEITYHPNGVTGVYDYDEGVCETDTY